MSSEVPIPEEAVEKAARAEAGHGWDLLSETNRSHQRRQVRRALEAAAPLIQAAAFDELAAEGDGRDDGISPYELRRRASVLRGEGQTQ